MRDEVIEIMQEPPSLRMRKTVAERIIEKIRHFLLTFVEGVD
jgi:type I restriction enzyme R subunit